MQPPPEESVEPTPGFLSTELANTVTHGLGLLLSIIGLVVLVVSSTRNGDGRLIVACSVYGATLVLLYLASTLYHSVGSIYAERVFRAIDHAAIYLLIAGTYTPFTLVSLGGGWGWSLFGVVWGLALLGIVFKTVCIERFKLLSLLLYLAMGWLALVAIEPLVENVPRGGLMWMFAGGAAYTLGVVFYLWKSIPHHHAIWHLFVMAGSTCHFFAVMFYVVPAVAPALP